MGYKKDKEKIKKNIIQFVRRSYQKSGIVPSARKINKEFNISFWSYFPMGMNSLYELCGFKFSLSKIEAKLFIKQTKKDEDLKV